jgi:hypothetical protein
MNARQRRVRQRLAEIHSAAQSPLVEATSGCPNAATHIAQTDYGTHLICKSCADANHMMPKSVRPEGLIGGGANAKRCTCEHSSHFALDEGTKYHTCTECEANFPSTSLVDGKLPAHKFLGKPCPGSGTLAEGNFRVIQDNVPEKTRMNRINKFLSELGRTYHQGVPISAILDNLKQNGFMAVQEDGTEWEGLILGKDARYTFDLVDMTTGVPSKRVLVMSHHKMEVTGKYEVVAYIS